MVDNVFHRLSEEDQIKNYPYLYIITHCLHFTIVEHNAIYWYKDDDEDLQWMIHVPERSDHLKISERQAREYIEHMCDDPNTPVHLEDPRYTIIHLAMLYYLTRRTNNISELWQNIDPMNRVDTRDELKKFYNEKIFPVI